MKNVLVVILYVVGTIAAIFGLYYLIDKFDFEYNGDEENYWDKYGERYNDDEFRHWWDYD